MAVIAIFCDGTWSRFDSKARTHVARLAAACAETRMQKILYYEGVGTRSGSTNAVGRWFSKLGGGLFGWGLDRAICAAYRDLCRIYQPGDRIMVFGFSRGAYTARSLVGMIRKCGILADPSHDNIRRAFRLYRLRGADKGPDTPDVWAARRRLSPDYATSAADVMRRGDHSYLVRITYLGIWDTVGALGIPASLLGPVARFWNRRYAFHDTSLSHLVEQARHAVALDEKRTAFEPALWGNLTPSAAGPGLNGSDLSDARPYQQIWFAGSHSVVGGSSAPHGLAAASLSWIWAGARQAGLTLKPGQQIPDVAVDAVCAAPMLYHVGLPYSLVAWLLRWRQGPVLSDSLHPTARLRAAVLAGYRPRSLARVLPDLFRTK